MDWRDFRLSTRLVFDAATAEEFYRLIAEIDAVKGSWRLTGRLLPQTIERLTHSVIVTSTGSSNRIEGIIRNEQERSNLQRVIADLETAIAVSRPGTRRVYESVLEHSKKRVSELTKKITDAVHERAAEAQAEFATLALARKETALNVREQETYGDFLKQEFFTRKDFGKLSDFYAHTWDRLSQGGKDEMSHRIWEGIRHHEYKFSELPDPVKEREEKQAYRRLHDPSAVSLGLTTVPEQDRADFIRAYENGNHKDAAKVLDRDSFRRNMFLETNIRQIKHASVTKSESADANAITANFSSGPSSKQPAQSNPDDSLASLDLTSVDLSGIKAANHTADGAVANLPRTRGESFHEL